MKRIKNIDLLRAGAILYIMLYHCYVLSGQPWQSHTAIHTLLTLGGEVGVTLFFLLSGYGILSFPFFFGVARLSPRLAGFYEKALHPHYAPVLCMYHGPSDLYVHADVQQ